MRERGRWVSANYLTFPGVNDRPEEEAALLAFLDDPGLSMIQWRNLNIDPEHYLRNLGLQGAIPPSSGLPEAAVKELVGVLRDEGVEGVGLPGTARLGEGAQLVDGLEALVEQRELLLDLVLASVDLRALDALSLAVTWTVSM